MSVCFILFLSCPGVSWIVFSRSFPLLGRVSRLHVLVDSFLISPILGNQQKICLFHPWIHLKGILSTCPIRFTSSTVFTTYVVFTINQDLKKHFSVLVQNLSESRPVTLSKPGRESLLQMYSDDIAEQLG